MFQWMWKYDKGRLVDIWHVPTGKHFDNWEDAIAYDNNLRD